MKAVTFLRRDQEMALPVEGVVWGQAEDLRSCGGESPVEDSEVFAIFFKETEDWDSLNSTPDSLKSKRRPLLARGAEGVTGWHVLGFEPVDTRSDKRMISMYLVCIES